MQAVSACRRKKHSRPLPGSCALGYQSAQNVIFPLEITVIISAIVHTSVTTRETVARTAGSSTKDRIDSTYAAAMIQPTTRAPVVLPAARYRPPTRPSTKITRISRTGENAFSADYLPGETHSYTTDYHYYTDDGSYTALSDDKIDTFVTRLKNLDWSDYATYTASDSSLGDYGLSSPEASFAIDYETDDGSGSFAVSFGKAGEDGYYCRMNDSAIVCKISESDYTSLAGTNANTLRPAALLSLDWDKVTALDFSVDDVTCAVSHKGSKFLYNDEETDFDAVKSAVNALNVSSYNSEAPTQKQEMEFTISLDNADYPTLTVSVYRYDGESCLVQLNGETQGLVSRSQISTLREAVTAIALGKADSADSAAQ